MTLLPLAYAAIAAYFILIPSASYISKSGVDRLAYELTQFIPLIVIVLLTIVFYIWGQREKPEREQDAAGPIPQHVAVSGESEQQAEM